ncbi:MAG TPA: fibronectin type III domain-containing protein, partial [Verrucomicrobiae bacterium]|nr:fibronectin type III domain-containing protein [Verrucomicrobiae bacterium]
MTKLYRLLRITPTSLVCSCFLLASSLSQADQANPYDQAADWTRSVQLSATVQESPPQITLSWDPDEYGSTNYLIYRKSQSSTSWGAPIASLDGSALSYSDPNVSVGSTYEYQVIEKNATYGYSSYGYIYSGIDANLIESRGALILIVATNSTAGLDSELAQYESDLIGDGWQVIRHDVSSSDSPASVRSLIVADYNADPAHVNAVFLFGHVPILQSGEINYDGHGDRPMPADGYYGDMDGDWSSSPSYFPSEIKLMVGRVDFANMPATAAPGTWPDETQLLGNYLKKDHRWRFGQITVPRRALIAERFGILNGIECRASSGYRNLAPFVGLGNTELADISNDADPANRWISKLSSGAYLWTYGNGGGQDSSISELGTHGIFNDVWSTDLYSQDAKAVFFMLEGSHFGNWDHSDDIVRAVLAMPTMGLICCN